MKKHILFLFSLALLTVTNSLIAQGTAFTYQGRLQSSGSPANGNYDFTFALYNTNTTSGTQVGSTLTNTNVGVTNGLFTVTLDFGSVFAGNATWLSIQVRTNGGSSFTTLNPLQELTPAPYAIYTPNAGSAAIATTAGTANSVAATNISGTVLLAQLPAAVVTNNEPNVALVNLTLGSNLNLSSPATIYAGGSSLLYFDSLNNFYAGPGAGPLTNTGGANTGIGYQSLNNNTNGTNNTAMGYQALDNNTIGSYNVANGERALFNNTTGNDNTANGRHALLNIQTGSNNIALGYQAGENFMGNESVNIDIGNPGVLGENNIIRIGSGQTNTFIAGVLNGNGSGLTSLPAANLTGTLPGISGTNLTGVALLSGGNAFSGNQTFAGGNVGIGYGASPAPVYSQEALYINSDNPIGAIIGMNGTTSGGHYFEIVSAGTGAATTAGSLGIFDYSVGTYRLSINASGNVGIGTTTPAATLEVNGNATVDGTLTAASFTGNGAGLTGIPNLKQIALLKWGVSSADNTFSVGSDPVAICFDGASIWVANNGGGNVTKLNAGTGATTGTYNVGSYPAAICFDGASIWVANNGGGNVTKLNASTGATIGTYNVGSSPNAICFDGASIWVVRQGGNNVTKL